ncbi:zinc-binding dehydrogenase [Nioella aestuarii]|uniref:zinc-binding dehydrogenase n=1 Tax=Nioella aestuarii TaxID=1662864 RepID=UPI003D7F687C
MLFKPIKHPFLGQRARGNSKSWLSELNLRAYAYLKDHRLQSDVIFPAAGYIDTMIAMCREEFGADKTLEIEDAIIHEALFIDPDAEILFSTILDPDRGRVKLYSRVRDANDDWVLRSEARVRVTDVKAPPARPFNQERKGLKEIDTDYVYFADTSTGFINYGDAFQTIDQLWMTASKTYARVVLQEGGKSTKHRHFAHPTMLDGCLQVLEPRMTLKRIRKGPRPGDPVCLPVGVGRIRVYGDFPDEVFVEADQIKQTNKLQPTAGFTVRDGDGRVLMSVERLKISLLPNSRTETEGDEVPAHFVRQDLVPLREEDAEIAPVVGRWLLLEGGAEDDASLAKALTASGAEVIGVARSELGEDIRSGLIELAADMIEAGDLAGIAVTWPLALPSVSEDSSTDELFGTIDRCTKDLIALGDLMDFARSGENGLPEIVVLTSGAYPDSGGGANSSRILTQMPVVAVARGLATETPEYRIRLIDADTRSLSNLSQLADRILRPGPETEVILRDAACLVPRLRHAGPDDFEWKLLTVPKADKSINFHATMNNPGVIDHVGLVEIPLQPIGPDEVRVRISAVGLNFRDIMAVTGLLPAEAEPEPAWENLGLEYGGVIEAVGEAVTAFKAGDRVMGLGKRCLQRFMTVNPSVLTLLPDHISLAQAATIPSAFATAHYALNHVGRMRPGEKVFIHVATGGVGTAAVQLAQAAGAEIFATAGSPEKRRLLKDLGVPHVMDSRSLKFADDVMKITKGAGVDILLNSLPGAYIAKGLDIMAPYGRFLEIGKRDVYEDAAIGMKALRRNVSLSVLDLAAMGEERPELLAEMFQELIGMLDNQALTPLPYTEFPISQIGDAIRYMSQAKHVGKVVVTLQEEEFQVRRDKNRPVRLSKNGSYLITGGTAGFSLSIADWL